MKPVKLALWRRLAAVALLVSAVAGCASGPPPVAPGPKLADAPAWAKTLAKGPTPVPVGDGDPSVRIPWLAGERVDHAQCVDRQRALVRHINLIRK